MTRFHLHADHPGRAGVLSNVLTFLPRLPESKSWEVIVKPLVKARTPTANAFMWSALYAPLVAVAGHTPKDWHEFMCGEYWGWKRVAKPGGRTEEVPKRTTTTNELGERDVLKGPAFADFLEYVANQAAQLGAFIDTKPAP